MFPKVLPWIPLLVGVVAWGCLESNPQPSPFGQDVTYTQPDDSAIGGSDLLADLVAPSADVPTESDEGPSEDWGDALAGDVNVCDTMADSAGECVDLLDDLGDVGDLGDLSDASDDLPDQPDLGCDSTDGGCPDLSDTWDVEEDLVPPQPWRSQLYPEGWTPGFADAEGRFLHDFSYAGYHHSQVAVPAVAGPLFSVADYGADPTGQLDATAAIQTAIEAAGAAGGGVVFFPTGLYRCDGLLVVTQSHVVLRGQGPDLSRVFFTKWDGMGLKTHLTFQGNPAKSAEWLLAVDGQNQSTDLYVEDASGLQPGDDISIGWVITPEFIADHQMTGVWQAFNLTWQPFFRRQVVAVDTGVAPNRVVVDVPLRYPALLRDQASVRRETGYLEEVGIEHLGIASAVEWEQAWANQRSNVVTLSGVKDGWVIDVASFVPPVAPLEGPGAGFHLQGGGVKILASKRVTVADCTLQKAQNRGDGGSGYLFEISMSNEILVRDCIGSEGRHNFIQNWGFGTTGCVWQRCHSQGGLAVPFPEYPEIGTIGYSEFHHSLATANLIEQCTLDDGWKAVNRQSESTGAGLTAAQNVFWNNLGQGSLFSRQFGWGYVIGTQGALKVFTNLDGMGTQEGEGSAPEDYVEGVGQGELLQPQSLFEDQFQRRTGLLPWPGPTSAGF